MDTKETVPVYNLIIDGSTDYLISFDASETSSRQELAWDFARAKYSEDVGTKLTILKPKEHKKRVKQGRKLVHLSSTTPPVWY